MTVLQDRIKKIYQKDNYSFTVEWQDGRIAHYKLSELQKQCPCANCVDEVSGKRLIPKESVDENVRAIRLKSVGRYALQIQFTSGCSSGIYGYDLLRRMI